MPNEPRLQTKDLILSAPEAQQRTPQEASPRSVTISSMTASTIVSTQLTSSHVGCFVIPEDGAIRGNPAQIKQFVLATTTATLDRSYHTTIAAGGVFRLWQPAEVPFVADSGSTTTIVDASHASVTNEPDDFFNDYSMLGKTGNNAGGAYKVNDFTSSSGTIDLTNDALGTTAAPGDLFLARYMHRPEGPVTVTVDRNAISRRIQGFGDADQAVVTISPGTLEGLWPQKPLSASAGSGVTATPPKEMGILLRDFMTQTLDGGSTYSSQGGSAPTGITTTVASGTNYTVGGFVLMSSGEASGISSKATNVLTTPHLTTAALVAGSNVFASAWYKRKTEDFRTRAWDTYIGKLQRRYLSGCGATCELQIARDQVIKYAMKYTASDAIEYNIASPNTLASHAFSLAVDTTVPVDGKGARFLIDSVPVLVGDVKIAGLAGNPIPRNSLSGMNQMDGYAFDPQPIIITVSGYLADNDDISSYQDLPDRLVRGEILDLFYQKGTNPKETFCWWAPAAQIRKASGAHDSGQFAFTFEAECVLPQVARGSTANAALPAFSLGQL